MLGRALRRLERNNVLAAAAGGLGADDVDRPALCHRDQPASRVLGHLRVPGAVRLEQRLLHGVLSRREVGAATDEDADHLRHERPQQGLVHDSAEPSSMTLRTWSHSWMGLPSLPGAEETQAATS